MERVKLSAISIGQAEQRDRMFSLRWDYEHLGMGEFNRRHPGFWGSPDEDELRNFYQAYPGQLGLLSRMPNHRLLILPWLKPIGSLFIRDWLAITIGSTILAARPLSEDERRHELVHVEQWRRFGLVFPLRYAGASLAAIRRGGDWYQDNEYEIEARGG